MNAKSYADALMIDMTAVNYLTRAGANDAAEMITKAFEMALSQAAPQAGSAQAFGVTFTEPSGRRFNIIPADVAGVYEHETDEGVPLTELSVGGSAILVHSYYDDVVALLGRVAPAPADDTAD